MLESVLADRNCVGTDVNPLAVLISQVKTTSLDSLLIKEYTNYINKKIRRIKVHKTPSVVNIDYWYSNENKEQLSKLKAIIDQIEDQNYKYFFLVCLSVCARKVSFADPRISVPVKLKVAEQKSKNQNTIDLIDKLEKTNAINKFNEIVAMNLKRVENFNSINTGNGSTKVILKNATSHSDYNNKNSINDESIDLVITSPPYAGAQKYIRASSLNLGWTGLSDVDNLQKLNQETIGRESYTKESYKTFLETNISEANDVLHEIYEANPLRAHIAANYLNEMNDAFSRIYASLKKDKYFVLIAANNQVCGREFLTQTYLTTIAQQLGFKIELELIDDIHSYGLMTKRNKTANVITREWVTVFKKG